MSSGTRLRSSIGFAGDRLTFSGLLLLGLVAKGLSVTETSSGMAEEIVWRGTSSLWRNTDTLELYRVKDIETRQPFLSRLVGVENVQLNTSDTSSPFVFIEAVPSSVGLADKLRNQVEIIRQQKRVREIDIE